MTVLAHEWCKWEEHELMGQVFWMLFDNLDEH